MLPNRPKSHIWPILPIKLTIFGKRPNLMEADQWEHESVLGAKQRPVIGWNIVLWIRIMTFWNFTIINCCLSCLEYFIVVSPLKFYIQIVVWYFKSLLWIFFSVHACVIYSGWLLLLLPSTRSWCDNHNFFIEIIII